jgi:glycosyltransferase involved in cell wall biosynthesis
VLHRSGKLEAVFTDYWSSGIWRPLARLAGAKRLLTRHHEELSDAEVYAFNSTALLAGLRGKLGPRREPYSEFLKIGSRFGRQTRAAMAKRREQDWKNTIFFGYDTGFLEAAAWAKDRGAATVVCQMDPSQVEIEMVREEEKLWPGWAKSPLLVPEEYLAWRKAEWALADVVMVNSKWTLDALVKLGVPSQKIAVVPLAYESYEIESEIPRSGDGPIRILYLGQVNLRKGIQYLLEAARRLDKKHFHFDIAGPISIADEHVVTAPSNVTFHGAVTRDRVREFYRQADVFVLPTISDGFALTQLEAMAHGLPVITTPNCGEVVRDGMDGFLIPARDASALAKALETLADDPERLDAMREAARENVARFGLEALDQNLRHIEQRLRPSAKIDLI